MNAITQSRNEASSARRAAFIEAARKAFFTNGYAGTSMSAIAAQVGGSKTTLWASFPSKQDLFVAVVDDIVERYGQAMSIELDPNAPVESALGQFAAAMMATLLSEPIISLHRLVTGEAARFPELGALFYERGPRRGRTKLAAYIGSAMADGRLRRGDPVLAARQFAAMCKSGSFELRLYALDNAPSLDAIGQDIAAAIDSFVRAWGN